MSSTPVSISITRLPHAKDLALPAYATEHSAGMDLLAAISEPITLKTGERKLVPTGLSIALPRWRRIIFLRARASCANRACRWSQSHLRRGHCLAVQAPR
jgi:dUTPase